MTRRTLEDGTVVYAMSVGSGATQRAWSNAGERGVVGYHDVLASGIWDAMLALDEIKPGAAVVITPSSRTHEDSRVRERRPRESVRNAKWESVRERKARPRVHTWRCAAVAAAQGSVGERSQTRSYYNL